MQIFWINLNVEISMYVSVLNMSSLQNVFVIKSIQDYYVSQIILEDFLHISLL